MSRITASTPTLLRPSSFNDRRPYRDQAKPFNFLMSVQVAPFGLSDGTGPGRFHLIARHRADPEAWERIETRSRRPYPGGSFSGRFWAAKWRPSP